MKTTTKHEKPDDYKKIIRKIAAKSLEGRLGLFIGTGFSKAVCGSEMVLGFPELLKKLQNELSIKNPVEIKLKDEDAYQNLPKIASTILSNFIEQTGMSEEQAISRFRLQISRLCKYNPPENCLIGNLLEQINPRWIVTTNYDTVIEKIFPKSDPYLSTQPLVFHSERVPVFHLHGHWLYPETIKITEEDYVGIMNPVDYHERRLPLLFEESLTLTLGYAKDDINVQVAIMKAGRNWQNPNFGKIIHAVYVGDNPRKQPKNDGVKNHGNITVVKIDSIEEVLRDISEVVKELESVSETRKTKLLKLKKQPTKDAIKSFVNEFPSQINTPTIIEAIDEILSPTLNKAKTTLWGFNYYHEYLEFLLDLIGNINPNRLTEENIDYIARKLNEIGPYIDQDKLPGKAHSASDLWKTKWPALAQKWEVMFEKYMDKKDFWQLRKMVKDFKPSSVG